LVKVFMVNDMVSDQGSKVPVLVKIIQYSVALVIVLYESSTQNPPGAGTQALIAFASLAEILLLFVELRIFGNSQQIELSKEMDEATEPVRREAVMMSERALQWAGANAATGFASLLSASASAASDRTGQACFSFSPTYTSGSAAGRNGMAAGTGMMDAKVICSKCGNPVYVQRSSPGICRGSFGCKGGHRGEFFDVAHSENLVLEHAETGCEQVPSLESLGELYDKDLAEPELGTPEFVSTFVATSCDQRP
jgi:hypothetical protein